MSSPRSLCPRGARELDDAHVEALTVAMVVAPGVYARNRMFDLFATVGVRRARIRAALVRGIVPQLARATTVTLSIEPRGFESVAVLRYAVAPLRLTRVVELSRVELAVLRFVAGRAGVRALPPEDADADVVATALLRLIDDEAFAAEARATRESIAPACD